MELFTPHCTRMIADESPFPSKSSVVVVKGSVDVICQASCPAVSTRMLADENPFLSKSVVVFPYSLLSKFVPFPIRYWGLHPVLRCGILSLEGVQEV